MRGQDSSNTQEGLFTYRHETQTLYSLVHSQDHHRNLSSNTEDPEETGLVHFIG